MANPYLERIRAAARVNAQRDPDLSYALYALAEMLAAMELKLSNLEARVIRVERPSAGFGKSPI